jgi:hypothetical protein
VQKKNELACASFFLAYHGKWNARLKPESFPSTGGNEFFGLGIGIRQREARLWMIGDPVSGPTDAHMFCSWSVVPWQW